MINFFKGFGKGILYLFVLPFCLIFLAFYGVIGLAMVIFLFFKSIVLFFQGRSLKIELPEDEEAKRILESKPEPAPVAEPVQPQYQQPQQTIYPQPIYPQQNQYQQPQPQYQQPQPQYQQQQPQQNYQQDVFNAFNQTEAPIQSPAEEVKTEPVIENNNDTMFDELVIESKEPEIEEIKIEDTIEEDYVPKTPKEEEYFDDEIDTDDDDIDITYGK